MWRSLVARFVRDEEAVGSNPATPTSVGRAVARPLVPLAPPARPAPHALLAPPRAHPPLPSLARAPPAPRAPLSQNRPPHAKSTRNVSRFCVRWSILQWRAKQRRVAGHSAAAAGNAVAGHAAAGNAVVGPCSERAGPPVSQDRLKKVSGLLFGSSPMRLPVSQSLC